MGRRQINGGVDFWGIVPPPSMAPAAANGGGGLEGGDHWRSFDNSVNAVSFGFVATAILISMFLVMAIFERFLRRTPSSAGGGRNSTDLAAQMRVQRKLDSPSPEMTFLCEWSISTDARRRSPYVHRTSCTRAFSSRMYISTLSSSTRRVSFESCLDFF